ncbi:MAG: thiol-disulfide oxidoreductase DCC family protein [Candidatus Loosdrechtia sp.]|uniref:thiol-disulfide oxidoreductase DCC family protein n=1 Tax=Candidatus Loosdrechtia sp. TaxID=3101272 RepID=UPI00403AD366
MKDKGSVIIIYDDSCCLCRGCIKWIELHALRRDIFEFLSCQSEERQNRFPEISEDACLQSLHVILPDRKIITGDMIVPEIVNRLRGFRWFSCLFKIPVIKVLFYEIYRWIAQNRYIISKTLWPLMVFPAINSTNNHGATTNGHNSKDRDKDKAWTVPE